GGGGGGGRGGRGGGGGGGAPGAARGARGGRAALFGGGRGGGGRADRRGRGERGAPPLRGAPAGRPHPGGSAGGRPLLGGRRPPHRHRRRGHQPHRDAGRPTGLRHVPGEGVRFVGQAFEPDGGKRQAGMPDPRQTDHPPPHRE